MKTTRRHKIAHSAVIRRVKPSKSEKAKRHKRKTHKRNTRNKVMKGGVHKDLKVYVIQQNLVRPKCFIIREVTRLGLDTIYLFFDAQLPNEELKTFLCAALNLENIDSIIKPTLIIPDETNSVKKIKSLFVKLSGIRSYTLSSGNLPKDRSPLSNVTVTKHTPDFKIGNGEEVIQRLKTKTPEIFPDHTFIDETLKLNNYFRSFGFTLSDVILIFDHAIYWTQRELTRFCEEDSELNTKVIQLRSLFDKQDKLSSAARDFARRFAVGIGHVTRSYGADKEADMEADKNHYIDQATKDKLFTEEDMITAKNLQSEIRQRKNYDKCKNIIGNKLLDFKFKTIKDIFDEKYEDVSRF